MDKEKEKKECPLCDVSEETLKQLREKAPVKKPAKKGFWKRFSNK